jgi:hypothetical protein
MSASTGFSSTGFLKETVGMADVTAEVTEDIFQDGRATLGIESDDGDDNEEPRREPGRCGFRAA